MDQLEKKIQKKHAVAAVGGIVLILLFLYILLIGYVPNRPKAIDEKTIETRKATLIKVREEQHVKVSTYGWVDQKAGIVHIPVDQAIQITLNDLNQQK